MSTLLFILSLLVILAVSCFIAVVVAVHCQISETPVPKVMLDITKYLLWASFSFSVISIATALIGGTIVTLGG